MTHGRIRPLDTGACLLIAALLALAFGCDPSPNGRPPSPAAGSQRQAEPEHPP